MTEPLLFNALGILVARTVRVEGKRDLIRSGLKHLFSPLSKEPGKVPPWQKGPVGFVPGMGLLHHWPPQRSGSCRLELCFEHSGFRSQPYYLIPNWRIRIARQLLSGIEAASLRFSLRVRVYDHLVIVPALTVVADFAEGLPKADVIRLVRGLADREPSEPVRLAWSSIDGEVEGTVHDLLSAALDSTVRGLGLEVNAAAYQELPLNQAILDIGSTSREWDLPSDEEELSRILLLDANPRRAIRDTKIEGNTFFESDWFSLNSRLVVFTDTGSPWPKNPGRHGRMMRRRPAYLWRMLEMTEVARIQLLWSEALRQRFEAGTLEIHRARHQSMAFLKGLLKATYYDDAALTMAMDIPNLHANVKRSLYLIYNSYSKRIELPQELARLDAAAKSFLTHASSWSPNILRLLDLVKLRNS